MTELLCTYRFGPSSPARVLAIHGLTGHGKRWETLFTQHLPDVTALAPDLLGHGRSSWDAPWSIDANVGALAALLDSEGGDPVLVVGHSFGGALALNLAAARPDLVSGLVLLDPAVALDGRWMREVADDMYASPDYTDRAEARDEKTSGSWGEVDESELDRELDEHLVDLPNGRVGWRISIPAMLCYWSELTRPVPVPRDGTPTTLVRALRTDPPYATDELITTLDAGLGPNLTVLEWDCDHMVPLAMPAETAALIRDQLR
ncbi:alpha/beta hydrolase [Mycolicibacterium sp. 018/SC-01/001]|uniref:alpha/beta hydrolase n=1 Tax=Mycolicibacterium sp. 018/SC-01/001 TaxID=2592069 RepID=UPI00117E9197|nr:alpha/beta hydrolase [Mycolicibacterium sp. 018/SC-01/001]TRW81162.1 alpha/beta hydrolase [Mycolicibacterium sp. 018/SC-01/001]